MLFIHLFPSFKFFISLRTTLGNTPIPAWVNMLAFAGYASVCPESPQVRESEIVLDLDSTPGTVELGFRIPIDSGIVDSLSCIPDSKAKDSGFHSNNLLDIGILQAKISRDPESVFPYIGWPKHPKWNQNLHFIPLDETTSIRAFSFEYVLLLHVFSCNFCANLHEKCTFTCRLTAFLYICIMIF